MNSEPARDVCPKCGGIGTILGRCKLESGNYGEVEVECSCQIKQPARDGIDVEEVPDLRLACPCSYPHMPHDGCDGRPQTDRLLAEVARLRAAVETYEVAMPAIYAERDAARARAEAKLAEYDTYVNSFGPGIRTAGK